MNKVSYEVSDCFLFTVKLSTKVIFLSSFLLGLFFNILNFQYYEKHYLDFNLSS